MTIKTLAAVMAALILVASSAQARTSTILEFDRHDARGYVPVQIAAVSVKRSKAKTQKRRHQDKPVIPANYASAPLVDSARGYIGQTAAQLGLPGSLWCGDFIAKVAPEAARNVRNPRMARDYAALPSVAPRVGAIAVLSRGRKGGHVGIVSGFDGEGNPIIISGNHGHKVGEGVYPKSRVLAYVSGG